MEMKGKGEEGNNIDFLIGNYNWQPPTTKSAPIKPKTEPKVLSFFLVYSLIYYFK
jgi:hypothetical protein